MPAVSFVDSTSNHFTGANSVTVTTPTGVASGDVLLACVFSGLDADPTTVPSGWTKVRHDGTASAPQMRAVIYTKVATGSEPANYTWGWSGGSNGGVAVVAYRGALSTINDEDGTIVVSTTVAAPSLTTTYNNAKLVAFYTGTPGGTINWTVNPSGMTVFEQFTDNNRRLTAADQDIAVAGATGTRSATTDASSNLTGQMVALAPSNNPPNAPTLVSPIGAAVINRADAQVFDWTFSDPDPLDSQSAYEFRYRLVGAGSWTTTGQVASATTQVTVTGGTLAAGDYEWQVRTWDALGVDGAWSASAFFTAASAPAVPTITAPTNGSTISTGSGTIDWSAPTQTSYQVRKVADSAGSPDTGTVYYDSGEVVSAVVRSAALTYPTNSRWEHLQVRIKNDGLWSSWASVRVQVSYTAPATPTAVVAANTPTGGVTISATHPAPTGSQPTVASMDIYRRETLVGGDGFRVAAAVAPSGSFVDWAVKSAVAYQYRVLDIGDTGTTAFSAWVS